MAAGIYVYNFTKKFCEKKKRTLCDSIVLICWKFRSHKKKGRFIVGERSVFVGPTI